MFYKVTHYAGCVSANTRPHQLCWGDQEVGTAISCTKCSQSLAGKSVSCLHRLTSLAEKGSWSLENANPKDFCATVIWSSLDSPLIISEAMSNCTGEKRTSWRLPGCYTSQLNSNSILAQELSIDCAMVYCGSFCSSKFSPDEVNDHIIRKKIYEKWILKRAIESYLCKS